MIEMICDERTNQVVRVIHNQDLHSFIHSETVGTKIIFSLLEITYMDRGATTKDIDHLSKRMYFDRSIRSVKDVNI